MAEVLPDIDGTRMGPPSGPGAEPVPPLPTALQVEVTSAGNLRCAMCLVRYRPPVNKLTGALPLAVLRRLVSIRDGARRGPLLENLAGLVGARRVAGSATRAADRAYAEAGLLARRHGVALRLPEPARVTSSGCGWPRDSAYVNRRRLRGCDPPEVCRGRAVYHGAC